MPDIVQPDDAAAAGSAAVAARRDHTHGIVCEDPASPSVNLSASAEGSGTSFARADHAHQLDQAIAPTWTALHTFNLGVTFGGATGVNVITVPDDAAQAMHIVDAGGIEYLRIVSTDSQPEVVIDGGAVDIDFRVRASGWSHALFVQGSDAYVGVGTVPSAPFHVHHEAMFNTGIAFSGTVPTPYVKVPDNAAIALRLLDAGDTEYLRIISTDAQPTVVFNEGGADVDHRWEASGEANALFVQGSDGKIGIHASTLNARVEIGGTPGPAIVNLPTNLSSTIDAGIATRDVADQCILTFGANVHSLYTGRTVQDKAGACIRIDTRDQDGGITTGYTVFQILTRAAGGNYAVPFQIAAGAPTASLWITRTGNVNIRENGGTVRLSGTFAWVFVIPEPIVETIGQIRIPWACTVTRVDGNVQGGTSCTINIEERGTLGSAGTNILTSDMVADANGESVTSSFNNSSLAAGNHLAYDVSAVSGAVGSVSITITGTID